ncbi:MAG TPA: 7-carboxy-7-deazaguanine synthase QueE [Gammaproteobacteria bacterium]|nr:7-carboxy-7-deazaguanine synthase QueE [Xanthomonadales bacterium]MCB1594466.1 7-carboxy-7-deazaguanine synthase QueE [Xanthomonadales bacterium]HOP23274.1 7-carboxy-7-deazaguanine synthase QueE [Gammaproteobacteria bacterium]HPI95702.1 7-carboxy-7-deazaguanine synthase QueE [Gammaproteobacteria bacterium]HPQ86895.1 7-carboxy-7-deazaguanine synthase QueE [Gammaproteobacteria bacterium]
MERTGLKITEIFHSIQGESTFSGLPTVFIRLTGCPLRCTWCDTEYSFSGGKWFEIEEILQEVRKYKTPYVCVTGGEPLSQKRCLNLLDLLVEHGFTVSLETSGALPISDVNDKVVIVMDLKAPGSGELQSNHFENINYLDSKDQVKFVIKDRADYHWALEIIERYNLTDMCEILFSPVAGEIDPANLAQWMLDDNVLARLQLQMHKILWNDSQGR